MQAQATALAYRLTEAGKLIGVSRSQLYVMIAAGTLRTFKSGKARLVTHRALEDFLEKAEGVATKKRSK